jgi:hypothetical protein
MPSSQPPIATANGAVLSEESANGLVGAPSENHEPGLDGRSRALDSFVSYMPLRCAWACTSHKSQGLTLDQVQIDLRDHFRAHPGSLYVTLSRVRPPAGIRLVGSPADFIGRCNADPRVRPALGEGVVAGEGHVSACPAGVMGRNEDQVSTSVA